ncbi:transposase [Brevibacillus sp. NRS-1366]
MSYLSCAIQIPTLKQHFPWLKEVDSIAILCECDVQPLPQKDNAIGIDLGLKEFAVCSNEEVVANPKHLRKREKQLAR